MPIRALRRQLAVNLVRGLYTAKDLRAHDRDVDACLLSAHFATAIHSCIKLEFVTKNYDNCTRSHRYLTGRKSPDTKFTIAKRYCVFLLYLQHALLPIASCSLITAEVRPQRSEQKMRRFCVEPPELTNRDRVLLLHEHAKCPAAKFRVAGTGGFDLRISIVHHGHQT